MKYLKSVLIGLLLFIVAVRFPDIHYNFLRSKAQQGVVMITRKDGRSGGTGFHIKSPSGKVYILTNAHVCGLAENNVLYITDDFNRTIPRQVLETSDETDLCLVEPLPNYHGYLKVGSESSSGQIVWAVGHPALMPTTMTQGEVIGKQKIVLLDHYMNDPEDGSCNLPKNRILKLQRFFGEVIVCAVEIEANLSTVLILPGSSGSPVVNFWGKVVGVIFAGTQNDWGIFITVKDINKFLEPY